MKERQLTEIPVVLPGDPKEAGQYLLRLHRDLQVRLSELESSFTGILHTEPAKRRDGMVRRADGADWNPGFGAGLYQQQSGAWNLLGGAAVGGAGPLLAHASWALAIGANAAVGTNLANPVTIALSAGLVLVPLSATIQVRVGDEPTGSSLIVDINYTGPAGTPASASIFASTKLVVPAGSSAVVLQSTFSSAGLTFAPLGWFTADIDQVGSTLPGKTISVTLLMEVK